ncbi:MAG: hypothetical protein GX847_08225, partial [Clostridiales bacterium]|nr:hypothetical protein [Clostridiales bacterium]
MIFSLCACDRIAGDEVIEESTAPAETGGEELTILPEETLVEASASASVPPGPYNGRSDLVILNWEEYLNRPHEIQPGTVLNYAGYDLQEQLPWDCAREGWFADSIYEGLLYM